MNTALWIVQAFLALAFLAAGSLKIFFYDRFKAFVDEKGPSGMKPVRAPHISILRCGKLEPSLRPRTPRLSS